MPPQKKPGRNKPNRWVTTVGVFLVAALLAGLVLSVTSFIVDSNSPADSTSTTSSTLPATTEPPATTATTTTTEPPPPEPVWVDPQSSRQPWGSGATPGVLTFRGSPTRSWYGTGPIATSQPSVQWTYPPPNLEGLWSPDNNGVPWHGTGWTGQPAVFEYDGLTWVVFGAFDGAVHFLNAENGQPILEPFQTGGHIKGSVTIDPDGYPLVYFGSRDHFLRVVAFDRSEATELWRLGADQVPGDWFWSRDWDSSPMVIDDYLFEGGENSRFHIIKLNRGYDTAGQAAVEPTLEHHFPGWDEEQRASLGATEAGIPDRNLSIENSVAISGNTMYFANSGGLVQGWDLTGLGSDPDWQPQRAFRYWVGDDVDATITIDEQGMLYVAVERERTSAAQQTSAQLTQTIGQLLKLDPSRPDDPLVWSVHDLMPLATNPAHLRDDTGFWATPAISDTMVYAASNTGRLLGIDRQTGVICWERQFTEFLWSSPVVVPGTVVEGELQPDVLLQATGGPDPDSGRVASYLRAYDLSADQGCTLPPADAPATHTAAPELWALPVGWRFESTPAVWQGSIYIGNRNGYFYAIR